MSPHSGGSSEYPDLGPHKSLGFNDLPVAKIIAYSSMFLHQNGLPSGLKKFRLKLIKSLLFDGVNDVPHAHPHVCGCFRQTGIRSLDETSTFSKRTAMRKNEIILLVILALLIGIYIGSVDYLSKIIISNFG